MDLMKSIVPVTAMSLRVTAFTTPLIPALRIADAFQNTYTETEILIALTEATKPCITK